MLTFTPPGASVIPLIPSFLHPPLSGYLTALSDDHRHRTLSLSLFYVFFVLPCALSFSFD